MLTPPASTPLSRRRRARARRSPRGASNGGASDQRPIAAIAAVDARRDVGRGSAGVVAAAVESAAAGARGVVHLRAVGGAARARRQRRQVRARLRAAGHRRRDAARSLPDGIAFEFLFAGDTRRRDRGGLGADGITVERAAARRRRSMRPPIRRDLDAGDARAAVSAAPAAASHVVRVDLARLDELMRMVGDLVISRARLADTLARVERRVPPVEWRAVQENSALIERQLRDLREGVMRVRLVPVGEIFRRMPFVVRDLARETGAKVRLVAARARTPRSTSS